MRNLIKNASIIDEDGNSCKVNILIDGTSIAMDTVVLNHLEYQLNTKRERL